MTVSVWWQGALLSMVVVLAFWLVLGFQRAGHEDIRARLLSNPAPRATTDIPRLTGPSTVRVADPFWLVRGFDGSEGGHDMTQTQQQGHSPFVLAEQAKRAEAFQLRIADKITAMDQGRIVAEGTPEEIRQEASLQKIYARGGVRP